MWLDVDRTGLINVVDLFFLLKVCAFFLQCRKKKAEQQSETQQKTVTQKPKKDILEKKSFI